MSEIAGVSVDVGDITRFDGLLITDAIDREFGPIIRKQIELWDFELRAGGVHYLRPRVDELADWLIPNAWSTFCPALERLDFPPGPYEFAFTDHPELGRRYKLLVDKIHMLFATVSAPIFRGLCNGTLAATGLPLPEVAHDFRRVQILQDYWSPNLWVLYRNGSRFRNLDRVGNILESGFGSVTLSAKNLQTAIAANDPTPGAAVATSIYPQDAPASLSRFKYRDDDWPLLVKMRGLIKEGRVRSIRDAAQRFKLKAAGEGHKESIAKRLEKSYAQVSWEQWEGDRSQPNSKNSQTKPT